MRILSYFLSKNNESWTKKWFTTHERRGESSMFAAVYLTFILIEECEVREREKEYVGCILFFIDIIIITHMICYSIPYCVHDTQSCANNKTILLFCSHFYSFFFYSVVCMASWSFLVIRMPFLTFERKLHLTPTHICGGCIMIIITRKKYEQKHWTKMSPRVKWQ